MLLSNRDKEIRQNANRYLVQQWKRSSTMPILALMHVGLICVTSELNNYNSWFVNFGIMFFSAYILALIVKQSMSAMPNKEDLINTRLSESIAFKKFVKFCKVGFLALLIIDLFMFFSGEPFVTPEVSATPLFEESVVEENGLMSIFMLAAINGLTSAFFLGVLNFVNVLISVRLLESEKSRECRLTNPMSELHYMFQGILFGIKCTIMPLFIASLSIMMLEHFFSFGVNMYHLRDFSLIIVSYLATIYAAQHYFVLRNVNA